MNDLQTLRAALISDEPSQDVTDRSRHRLRNRMLGEPSPRKRLRLLSLGAGLTAAAVAAVVVVATSPAVPDGGTHPVAEVPVVTAPDILLAAATAAERTPPGSGTYWNVKVTVPGDTGRDVFEHWITTDGRQWFRGAKTGGRVQELTGIPAKFWLSVSAMTLEQLRALPTDPAALRDRLVTAIEKSDARTSAGPLTASDREVALLQSLVALVSTLPAPPEVRAAAFRAIAAYPGVRSLGAVPGGQGLLLPGDERLVVDPSTGRVNGTSVFMTTDGAEYRVSDPRGAEISAAWTDSLPG